MGQKVSPHGLRVGVIKDWNSKWFADKKSFADALAEDNKIRKFVKKKLYVAGISKIVIERAAENTVKVIISTAKPGVVIGRSGAGVDELRKDLTKLTGKKVDITVEELKRIEMDAQLTAEGIAAALERRASFRKTMKQSMQRTMKAGAKGVKILCSGRLGGAEIARNEKYSEGNVPLHTLRANIDYGFAEADTTYGKIGVKVWINHGEILEKGLQPAIIKATDEGKRGKRGKGGDRRRRSDRRRFDNKRNEKPERPKAVNPRVRKAPKEEPVKEEPQVNKETEAVEE